MRTSVPCIHSLAAGTAVLKAGFVSSFWMKPGTPLQDSKLGV